MKVTIEYINDVIHKVRNEKAPDFNLIDIDEKERKEYMGSLRALKILIQKYDLNVKRVDPSPTEGWEVIASYPDAPSLHDGNIVLAETKYRTNGPSNNLRIHVSFKTNGIAGIPTKTEEIENVQNNPEKIVKVFEEYLRADDILRKYYLGGASPGRLDGGNDYDELSE